MKSMMDEFKNDKQTLNSMIRVIRKEVNGIGLLQEIFPTLWEKENSGSLVVKAFYNHFYSKHKDKKKTIKVVSQYIGQVFFRCIYDSKNEFIQFKKNYNGIKNNTYIRIS